MITKRQTGHGHAARPRRESASSFAGQSREVRGYERPSTFSEGDDALLQNRRKMFKKDRRFRDEHVDFQEAARVMDTKSDDTDEDGVPAVNHVRRVVHDALSVALMNLPEAKLSPNAPITPDLSKQEQKIRTNLRQEATETMNDVCTSIKMREQYQDLMNPVLSDAAVYGPGYLSVWGTRRASTRGNSALQSLLRKPRLRWTIEDVRRFETLAKRVQIDHVDSRRVYWQQGVTSARGDHMNRVSRHRYVPTVELRDRYDNDDIMPGGGQLGMRTTNEEELEEAGTGVVTMWELEQHTERESTSFFMGVGGTARGATLRMRYEDQRLVKTVFAPTSVLEHRTYDGSEAVMRLPIVPFYLDEAQDHPYGFGLPAQLKLTQKFINRIRTLLYKQAEESVSPQAVAVMTSKLGRSDREQVEQAFEEGGVAWLEGVEEVQDVRQVVQSMRHAASAPNQALSGIMQNEEQALRRQGGAVQQAGFNRIRSAKGKQAHMSAVDRPKTYSVNLLSESQENALDHIYEWVQRLYRRPSEAVALVGRAGAGGQSAVLNDPVRKPIVRRGPDGRPIRDPRLATPQNPTGLAYKKRTFRRNDTQLPMKAQAEGRGKLPIEPMARLRAVGAMAQAEMFLSKRTARQLALDDELKALDDANAAKDRREAAKKRQMQQMMQQQGVTPETARGGNGGGPEEQQAAAGPAPAGGPQERQGPGAPPGGPSPGDNGGGGRDANPIQALQALPSGPAPGVPLEDNPP